MKRAFEQTVRVAAVVATAALLVACGGPRADLRMMCAQASDVTQSGQLPPDFRRMEWAKRVAERIGSADVAQGLADVMSRYPPGQQYSQLRALAKRLGAEDWHCGSLKRLLSGR